MRLPGAGAKARARWFGAPPGPAQTAPPSRYPQNPTAISLPRPLGRGGQLRGRCYCRRASPGEVVQRCRPLPSVQPRMFQSRSPAAVGRRNRVDWSRGSGGCRSAGVPESPGPAGDEESVTLLWQAVSSRKQARERTAPPQRERADGCALAPTVRACCKHYTSLNK